MEPKPTLDLSPVEIERLLRIMGAAQGFIRHDLAGETGLILSFFHDLQEFFDGEATADDLRALKKFFPVIKSRITNILHVVNAHLVGRDVLWSLVSHLPDVAEEVVSRLEERGVTVLPPQGPDVHVTFPQSALYSIMLELARNAAVHAPGSRVALEWSIQSETLIVSVHDNGGAISHLLTDRLLALELAQPELFKTGGGLSIIRRILHYSGGLLLVRRSGILGGAEFSVHLPIGEINR